MKSTQLKETLQKHLELTRKLIKLVEQYEENPSQELMWRIDDVAQKFADDNFKMVEAFVSWR